MPQSFNVRDIVIATNRDEACVNGLENTAAAPGVGGLVPGGSYVLLSKTLTAGPQTTGPVFVSYNGIQIAIPWNTAVSLPAWAWNCLDSTVWTYA